VTLAIAHRGDPYHFRENTLPSIRSALRKGADVVEVDVRLTRDGVPVLLHDPTLERLWGHDVPVTALTAEDAGALTGDGVPTLAEGLAELHAFPAAVTPAQEGAGPLAAAGPAAPRLLIDLTEAGQAAPAIAAVRDAGLADRVYYCGELPAMLAVRAADPGAEIAMTWKTSRRPSPALIDEVKPRWLNLRFGLVDPSTVAFARDHGLLVGAWTADWGRSMSRLLVLGVDAVTTNRLDALQKRLTARRLSR
jgi:glycerophosphoryl diester phosphodiesterase